MTTRLPEIIQFTSFIHAQLAMCFVL